MPSRRDEAFVLARYPFRERDLVVTMLARAGGQVRVLARRARGARSTLAAALEPLALVSISYFERPHSELATLDEATLVRSAFPLAARPLAWAAGQVVAELALVFCPPGQRLEAAFRLVDRCVECLLRGQPGTTVAEYAELWFLRLAGVFPELGRCGSCGAELGGGARVFDPAEGVFVGPEHATPRGAERLSAEAVQWLSVASRAPLEALGPPPCGEVGTWLTGLSQRFTSREIVSRRYLAHLQRPLP